MSKVITLEMLEGKNSKITPETTNRFLTMNSKIFNILVLEQDVYVGVARDVKRRFIFLKAYKLINNDYDDKGLFILIERVFRFSERSMQNNSFKTTKDYLIDKGKQLKREMAIDFEHSCFDYAAFSQNTSRVRIVWEKDYKEKIKS